VKKPCSLWLSGLMLATCTVTAASFLDGALWTPSNGPPGGVVNVLAAQGSSLYAGTGYGLYKSTDGGASWRITSFPLGSSLLSLAFTDGVILAGTEFDGVFRSVDEGDSWIPANQGLDARDSILVSR
jgi:hypothetical protein